MTADPQETEGQPPAAGGRPPDPTAFGPHKMDQQDLLRRLSKFSRGMIRVASVARAAGRALADDYCDHKWKLLVTVSPLPLSFAWMPALMIAHYATSSDPKHMAKVAEIKAAADHLTIDQPDGSSFREFVHRVPGSPGTLELDGWGLTKKVLVDMWPGGKNKDASAPRADNDNSDPAPDGAVEPDGADTVLPNAEPQSVRASGDHGRRSHRQPGRMPGS